MRNAYEHTSTTRGIAPAPGRPVEPQRRGGHSLSGGSGQNFSSSSPPKPLSLGSLFVARYPSPHGKSAAPIYVPTPTFLIAMAVIGIVVVLWWLA